MLLGTIKWSR